jgi:hypothetical protein
VAELAAQAAMSVHSVLPIMTSNLQNRRNRQKRQQRIPYFSFDFPRVKGEDGKNGEKFVPGGITSLITFTSSFHFSVFSHQPIPTSTQV